MGTNEVQSYHSERAKRNIGELCEFAKTMSDIVVFSGPLPAYWCKKKYQELISLQDGMSDWCQWNNVGFINNWAAFLGKT